ncbi:hypothetical protein GCM10010244_20930 [Streptomyces coeruleorubidus]|nr:hypothetical protein GCM10010244_20930 [Streptomyces bellus]
MYVLKRTESNRGGGTISATSRSAGTCGSRAHRDSGAGSVTGPDPEGAGEEDTVHHARACPADQAVPDVPWPL